MGGTRRGSNWAMDESLNCRTAAQEVNWQPKFTMGIVEAVYKNVNKRKDVGEKETAPWNENVRNKLGSASTSGATPGVGKARWGTSSLPGKLLSS